MMYEVSFATLSDRFFKGTSWPHVDYIADLVDNDHVFCLLYKVNIFQYLFSHITVYERLEPSITGQILGPHDSGRSSACW